MNCKNCGFEFEESTKFCPECGTKVEMAESTVIEADNDETVEAIDDEMQTENNEQADKKKIVIVAAVAAIAVVLIVIIIIASKSGSNNNYYGNGDSYNNSYNDYNDNFGNNEIVTQPQTTEIFTLDYIVDFEKSLNDYMGAIASVTDYKFVPQNSVYGVCWGVEIKFNFDIINNPKNQEYFSYDLEYYDKNGNLIGTDNRLAHITDTEARDTALISFDMLNGELSKIVVLGH